MRALDLFCCAGGAGMGLHRAGLSVLGVDIIDRPRYPFRFVQADALAFPLGGFDFIWASPPCQGYSVMRHAPGARGAPKLIGAVRDRLEASGADYCIENVEEARSDMRDPITLCGCMFGLGSQGCRLQRRRLFECSFPVDPPACVCDADPRPVIGVYGGHARKRAANAGGRGTRDVWEGGHRAAASEAMGIDWATLAEMSEAIPPVYSEFIARAWLQTSKGDPMTIGDQLAAQQRETAARALAEMERAHKIEAEQTWEQRRAAGRAWAYQRAGLPVPAETDGALTRARALLAAKDPWDTIPIYKADLAELVALAERAP